MFAHRKAFTLVELLVVIIIIGVLGAMLVVSSGAITARSEAAKVIQTMKIMKSSATLMYQETASWEPGMSLRSQVSCITTTYGDCQRAWATALKHTDSLQYGKDAAKFELWGGTGTNWVHVIYKVGLGSDTFALRKALESMAKEGAPITGSFAKTTDVRPAPYRATDKWVYMFVSRYP